MAFRVLLLLCLALSACQYDGSVPVLDEEGADAGAGATCEGFAPEPCGECGREICIETASGIERQCVPDAASTACGADATCDADGMCTTGDPVDPNECQDGDQRECGGCGEEACVNGAWSGTCQPVGDRCGDSSACVSSDGQSFSCQPACTTQGHRQACNEGESIADAVPVGSSWGASDDCFFQDSCRQCSCVIGFDGKPFVSCDFFCQGN